MSTRLVLVDFWLIPVTWLSKFLATTKELSPLATPRLRVRFSSPAPRLLVRSPRSQGFLTSRSGQWCLREMPTLTLTMAATGSRADPFDAGSLINHVQAGDGEPLEIRTSSTSLERCPPLSTVAYRGSVVSSGVKRRAPVRTGVQRSAARQRVILERASRVDAVVQRLNELVPEPSGDNSHVICGE